MSNLSSATTRTTNVETDVLTATGTPAVNQNLTTSSTPTISGLSLNSGRLVISSGYSWLLECNLSIYGTNAGASIQWYNHTTASYIGQIGFVQSSNNGVKTYLRQTRKVSRALVLSADFGGNSTLILSPRVVSINGSPTSFSLTNYTEPTLRIMRIS